MRPLARLFPLLCVTLCPPTAASADGPATADDVIAAYVRAIGGREALDAVRSMRTTGKLVMPGGREARILFEFKRPNKVRTELTLQGATGIQAFDGRKGWYTVPFAGGDEPHRMPASQARMMKEQSEIHGPLVDYKKNGHRVELLGVEKVGGVEAYKLKLTRSNGEIEYHYLGREDFLPIKVIAERPYGDTEVETVFGDYRKVGGVMIAHSVEREGGSAGVRILRLEKVEVNVELSDERFAMPKTRHRPPRVKGRD